MNKREVAAGVVAAVALGAAENAVANPQGHEHKGKGRQHEQTVSSIETGIKLAKGYANEQAQPPDEQLGDTVINNRFHIKYEKVDPTDDDNLNRKVTVVEKKGDKVVGEATFMLIKDYTVGDHVVYRFDDETLKRLGMQLPPDRNAM